MTEQEFQIEILKFYGDVRKYALSLTRNRDEAFDLTQDIFVKALTNADKFAVGTNTKAWLFTIAKNTYINIYRREQNNPTISDETPNLHYINQTTEKGHISPESVYSEVELYNIINNLSVTNQVPFKMHIEGYKYEEIAEKLNVPIGTVKSRIFFARKEAQDIYNGIKQIQMVSKFSSEELLLTKGEFVTKYHMLKQAGWSNKQIVIASGLCYAQIHKIVSSSDFVTFPKCMEKMKRFVEAYSTKSEMQSKTGIEEHSKQSEPKPTEQPDDFWDLLKRIQKVIPANVSLTLTFK